MNLNLKRFVTKAISPEFIIAISLVPSILLLGYCSLFIALNRVLSPYLSPDNVNYYFVRDLFTVTLAVLLASLLVLVFMGIQRRKVSRMTSSADRQSGEITASLLIALLPLVPVIRYLFSNKDIFSLLDVVVLLGACLGASVALIVFIPALLRKYSSFRLLTSVAGAFVFTIVNMAAISGLLHWLEAGKIEIQLLLFAFVLAVMWLLLRLQNKKDLAFIVVAFLVSNIALMSLSKSDPSPVGGPEGILLEELVSGKQPARLPNIYLLVYDAYVPNETMLAYGIDNSEQEAFLVEQGFTLYPHTYSVAADSLRTMNRVFNISMDHDSDPQGQSRDGASGNGIVHELLRSMGYRTTGIFPYDYMFRGTTPKYDYYTPSYAIPSYQLLFWGIWMGEFRYDIGFQTMTHEEYVRTKRTVLSESQEDPIFIYTHSSIPGHSQNSGICLPDETERFYEKLVRANAEMRDDVAAIIASDPDSIVIVAGDHGPYLTKNCTVLGSHYDPAEITRIDIQDRKGAFLAVRWPSEDYGEYDEITVLQDLFPAILAWMYRDQSLLEARPEPNSLQMYTGGVVIKDGIIVGGADDGQPLYLSSD